MHDEDVSTVFSYLLEILVLDGLSLVINVVSDGRPIMDGVLDHHWDEFHRMLEDISPFLDSSHIILHSLTVSELIWDLLQDLSEDFDSIHDVTHVFLHEVLNGRSKLIFNFSGVFETFVDLVEVVFVNELDEHTVDEHFDVHWGDGGLFLVEVVTFNEVIWHHLGTSDSHAGAGVTNCNDTWSDTDTP